MPIRLIQFNARYNDYTNIKKLKPAIFVTRKSDIMIQLSELSKMKNEFMTLKALNAQLIDTMATYANQNNCWDKVLMQGCSFTTGLELLNKVKTLALLDAVLKGIETCNSPGALENNSKNLNIQIHHHYEVKGFLELIMAVN
jgi:hypothetical protein